MTARRDPDTDPRRDELIDQYEDGPDPTDVERPDRWGRDADWHHVRGPYEPRGL